ncbi:MAG: PAS domain S-box protein [Paludibacter sp.]|nr:PAS domain S-box protein [Paludibacter sp.]
MNNHDEEKVELFKELKELRKEHNHLKSIYLNDIFELKLVENALKESEAKCRLVYDDNPQVNWIYDCKTLSFLDVNEAAVLHYGYTKQEFLSMTLKDLIPDENNLNQLQDDELQGSPNEIKEDKHVKKNGELIFVDVVSHTKVFNGCDVCHAVVYDITDRKLAEEKLVETELKLASSISELSVGIHIVTVSGETVYANKPFLDMFELADIDEFIAMSETERYTHDSYVRHQELVEKRNSEQDLFQYEISLRNSAGQICHAKVSREEILWNGIKHYQVIVQNITVQKNTEDELGKLYRVLNQHPDAMYIANSIGIIEYVNYSAMEIGGFYENEPIGFHLYEFYSGLKPQESVQLWETVKLGDVWTGEVCNKKENGEVYWEAITVTPIFDNQNNIAHFLSIIKDVTLDKNNIQDLILAKENAEESEIFLRAFVENIPFEIWACDVDQLSNDKRRRSVNRFGSILAQKLKLNAEICQKKFQLQENSVKCLMNGEVVQEEYEHDVNQQGNIFQQIAFPIYSKEEIVGVAGINLNITTRKLAEIALINSEEELRRFASHLQNVREEERSVLAREIHDDLGQILVALKIDLGMLKNKILNDDINFTSEDIIKKIVSLISLIDGAIGTARRIMNGLRNEQLMSLGLEIAAKEYLLEFEKRYSLKCEFICSVSKLVINEQQTLAFFRILQEAMTNIVKHAKATTVKVEFHNYDNVLILEIVDNGVGFDINNSGRNDSYGMIGMKERIFLLNGELDISSKVGKGTRIKVKVPYCI